MSRCCWHEVRGARGHNSRQGASTADAGKVGGWRRGTEVVCLWQPAAAEAAGSSSSRSSRSSRSGSSGSVAVLAPGRECLVGGGLNRGLHVRGALRGSQMVSHKWFTATREVHEWGEGCVDDWQRCAARAPASCRRPRLVRLAQEMQTRREAQRKKKNRGDWAPADEAVLM